MVVIAFDGKTDRLAAFAYLVPSPGPVTSGSDPAKLDRPSKELFYAPGHIAQMGRRDEPSCYLSRPSAAGRRAAGLGLGWSTAAPRLRRPPVPPGGSQGFVPHAAEVSW